MFRSVSFVKVAMMAALALVVLAPANPARAQEAAPAAEAQIPVAIGIVDVERIFATSSAGASLKKQADQQRKQYQSDVQAKETQLRAEGDKFNQQRASMTEAQVKQAVEGLQAKQKAYRQEFETKRKNLETAYGNARKKIYEALNKAILEIAQKRGLTLILKKSMVVVSAQAWDITDLTLAQLNKALPSVKM